MAIALDLAQIATRLLGGESFDSLMRSLLAKPERELLKYCASVRTFNEQMLDKFFRPTVSGGDETSVPSSRLREHSFVQPIPGSADFFQLREDSKRDYFNQWYADSGTATRIPPKLRSLSKELVSYYQSLGEGWELDVLYQQIVADSAAARRVFNKLYDAADDEFDLGRCQDLIKILEARHTILDENLRDLHADRQNYLKSRSFWSKEYYQTVYYNETAYLGARFDELHNHQSKWIMQLYAPGGRGKTMFLRWLTARRCAPARIPCAKIDFDLIDPVAATRNPWMLLLEIAQQLNEQIPGNLFGEQLGDLKEFRPVLTRSDRSQRTLSDFESRMGPDELKEIPDRFVRALKAARLKKKVVLIFDTLEEVILYQGTDLMALLEAVQKLEEKSDHKICLILSGRYDLNDKLVGFHDAYDKRSETLEITPFTPEAARNYLQEKRGITRLIDVVIEKANGNPFRLALYADILSFSPKVTEKHIREYPSDLLYLIRRVLLRIHDRRVRWLLRYGVIPRKLRLSFVKEVMAPYLPPAMAGASSDDDPEQDIKKELESDNAFKKVLKSPDQKVNIDRLWNRLNEYASTYSWVSQDEEANTVSFHSDVLSPMRAVLRNQRVYRKLHRAAIRHYEKKATANPEEWGTWILEAIYHKFQLDGLDAADYWRRQVEHSAADSKPRWRLDFAREVINLRKADEESSTTDGATRTALIDDQLLVQAYFEVARANADLGRDGNTLDGGDTLWEDARKAFAVYQQLQLGSKKPLVSPARSACLEAALLISGHERTEALKVIKGALKLKATAKDKIALHIEYAGALSLTGKYKESAKQYRTALKLASKARINPSSILQIRKDLAHHYELCGNSKEAIQEYKNALKFAIRRNDDLAVLELSRRLGEIYLECGQIAKGIQITYGNESRYNKAVSKSGWTATTAPEELMQLLCLKGRLALAMRDPFRARSPDIWGLVQQGIREGWHSQTVDRLTGFARELSGLVAAELMNDSAALDDFEQARLSWNAAKDRIGAARCLMHMIDVQLRVSGNVKAAKFLLEHAERLSLQRQPDLIRQELLAAEILALMGKSAAGQKRLRSLAARAKREKWAARDRAAIAIGSVIHRAQQTRSISGLNQVIAPFKLIWPPSARLLLLDRSHSCPTPRKPAALATRFATLLPDADWHRIDAPVHALKLADALRMVGRKLAPKSLLDRAEKELGKRQGYFAIRELYLVWDRLGWPDEIPQRVSIGINKVLRNFGNYPNWCGSLLLEQAERLMSVKDFDAANQILTEAAKYYEGVQDGSQPHARLNELRGRLLVEQNLHRQTRNQPPDKAEVAAVREGFKALSYAKTIYEGLQNRVAAKRVNVHLVAERRRLQSAVSKTSAKSKTKKSASTKRRRAALTALDREYAAEFERRIKLPKNTYALRLRRPPDGPLEFKAEFIRGLSKVRKDWKLSDSRFLSMLATKQGDTFSSVFCQLFPDAWWQMSQDMGKFLVQATLDRVPLGAVQYPDLALDLADPILAGIPWEFALLGSSKKHKSFLNLIKVFYRSPTAETYHVNVVRAIQFALGRLFPGAMTIDGVYGPATYQAVKGFQYKNKLSATGIADFETIAQLRLALLRHEKDFGNKVLIGQSSSDRQLSAMRGHGSAGTDLYYVYRRAGFKVDVVENPTIRTLGQALQDSGPQIIHLCPSMKRSHSSGVYLDFGTIESTGKRRPSDHVGLSSAATGESNYFSLSAVGKVLADFSAGKAIRPLLILDVPAPPVTSEAVIQLVLRNSFASELFRMGSTCAVMATGLMDRRQQTYVDLLVRSLAKKQGIGTLVAELREIAAPIIRKFGRMPVSDPEPLSLLLGPIGTALFSQNPAYLA